MKKLFCMVLAGLLLLSLAGCGERGVPAGQQNAEPSSAASVIAAPETGGDPAEAGPGDPETASATVPETAAATAAAEPAAPRPSLAWATAFRTNKVPSGSFHMDEIAFYQINSDDSVTIVNVPKSEIEAFAEEEKALPRCRYYEQFLDPALLDLLPILDYALDNSYSRFSVPSATFDGGMINLANKELAGMYRINDKGVSGLSVTTVEEDGISYDCVLVTMPGMEFRGVMKHYKQGINAAKKVLAEMPKGLSEYDKALYLYQYLTANVTYDYSNYYLGEWNFLYDALVGGKTICAGYAEALYFLYNLAGIECITQDGWVLGSDGNGAHRWAEARIDGEWYLFDATWDEGWPASSFRYFGLSDATLQERSPRDVTTYDREHCPPCPEDLPHP